MGGHAFGFEAQRLTTAQYKDYVERIIFMALASSRNLQFVATKSYSEKESHGDADIVVCGEVDDWNQFVELLSTSTYFKQNGNVVSVGVKLQRFDLPFQVDYIYAGPSTQVARTMLGYLDYNDCGNLIGILAKQLGFKYDMDGLTYKIRDPLKPTRVIKEITVSTDHRYIHEFLGLDHDEYLLGFKKLTDIFEWVAESYLFDPSLYLLENRNAKSRVRDNKRKTYTDFLVWCVSHEWHSFGYSEQGTALLRKHRLMLELKENTPFRDAYTVAMFKESEREFAKMFLNGELVSDLTGLHHKELGEFMEELKNSGWLDPTIILENRDKIADIVLNLYNNSSTCKQK